MVKKYAELYLDARRALLPTEGARAGFLARELLAAASRQSVESVLAHKELYASEEVEGRLNAYLLRVRAGEPLAYLLGVWPFHGLTLTVTPDVLIPRDDTEAVTELAIHAVKLCPVERPRVLDLCTGSGCIGLAIARRVRDAKVTLADVSQAALRVARRNVTDLKLGGRVTCVPLDVRKPAAPFLGKFDLIVSNPPYVTTAEMETLDPSVRDYEPHLALHGGEDGMDYYRAITQNYTAALRPGGWLALEFGMGQENAVCEILQAAGYEIAELREDNSGIVRAVLARFGEPEPEAEA